MTEIDITRLERLEHRTDDPQAPEGLLHANHYAGQPDRRLPCVGRNAGRQGGHQDPFG